MSAYQLACGCWQSELGWYEVGGVLGCLRHGVQTVIGVARVANTPVGGNDG